MTGSLIHGVDRVRFEDSREICSGHQSCLPFVFGIVATATSWKFIILLLSQILYKHGI
jgi:hypothetical protein